MPKFLNTVHKDAMNTLNNDNQSRLNNPMYPAVNVRRTNTIDFYNLNTKESTVDDATELAYASFGKESPFKYDIIRDVMMYDMPSLEMNLNSGEFGVESEAIEGDGLILPNTFVPVPGSFFSIQGDGHFGLFKVTDVKIDTIKNGANYFKVYYEYNKKDEHILDDQIVNEYVYVDDFVADPTKSAVIPKDNYDMALDLQDRITDITEYYKALFYDPDVDTFILELGEESHFYDPYLIQFIIDNKLMQFLNKYMEVQQELCLPNTFVLDYSKTIFNAIEKKKIPKGLVINAVGRGIEQPFSILCMRNEIFYEMKYLLPSFLRHPSEHILSMISPNLVQSIQNNITKGDIYTNIIIKYFNNTEITKEDIMGLDNIIYKNDIYNFYGLILLIYVLIQKIQLLVTT